MIWRKLGLAALVAAAGVAGSSWCAAEDEPAKKPAPAAKKEESTEEEPAAEKKPVDPFAVPEGNDPKVLQLFLSRLQRTPPKTRTPEGIKDHLGKLEKVADELLGRDLDEEMLTNVLGMKIQIMSLLPQFGDDEAAKRKTDFIAKAATDERPTVAKMAKMYQRMDKIQTIAELKKEERAALIQEIAKDI